MSDYDIHQRSQTESKRDRMTELSSPSATLSASQINEEKILLQVGGLYLCLFMENGKSERITSW